MSLLIKMLMSLAIFGGLIGIILPKTKSEKPLKLMLMLVMVCTALSVVFELTNSSLPEISYDKYEISQGAEAERTVEEKIEKIALDYGITCEAKAFINENYILEKIVVSKTGDERLLQKLKEETGFENISFG
ncbi:MAG: hypothetical protein DBX47_04340 [Clostridiales bacterium]|nr:MAG: hypothetical protein DBX47_04340 [Clostridiales bacterium]